MAVNLPVLLPPLASTLPFPTLPTSPSHSWSNGQLAFHITPYRATHVIPPHLILLDPLPPRVLLAHLRVLRTPYERFWPLPCDRSPCAHQHASLT